MTRNVTFCAFRAALLVISLFIFSTVSSAQHSNASHKDHHTEAVAPNSMGGEVQDWAKSRLAKSSRHQEWVKVKQGTREVNNFIVYPEVKNKATAVIVIHEINGLTDWVQSLTDQLAEAGYIAIAPDLLSGMGPGGGGTSVFSDRESVGKAIRDLPPDQITADLDAIAKYVGKIPAANGKVVVGGFCWGGAQTFRYATNNPNIKAAFVFYGSPPMKSDQTIDNVALARIKAPVYGFYAGNDARINATLPATIAAMKELGKFFEPVTYDGAGHGFMRAGDAPEPRAPESKEDKAADDKAAEDFQKASVAYKANKKARDEAWVRWKLALKQI
jgi:carboxymethylenebutenolidase